MKIAIIGHKRIPGSEGGVEVVVEELAKNMVLLGHDVTVFNRNSPNIEKHKNYKGAKIVNVPTINCKCLEALVYSFLATIYAVIVRFDVIHFHALGPSVMIIIAKIFRIKTVATVHGKDYVTPKWNKIAKLYLKLGEYIIAKFADEVIVLTNTSKQYFLEKYNRDVKVISNTVNIPTIRDANIISYKYGLYKKSYILFLGRVVQGKGIEYLIEAFKKIDTQKKLVIAGGYSFSSEYYDHINNLAKSDKRIIMTGFVSGNTKDELFSNCLLYVLPSDSEGMPISLLEAYSYGAKCLASDIPENLELADKGIVYFSKSCVLSLKKQLEQIILNQDTDNEFTKKIDVLSWSSITQQTVDLFAINLVKK